ncbi:hypothetical protein [uncultured Desulfobacter sp.]|uniref:hypothetical protein n=1 Tax=uncultured Desulfobacter sp. TaxID=240139 RepID=UPI00374A0297
MELSDAQQINQVISKIDKKNSALAAVLSELAMNFSYDAILSAIPSQTPGQEKS